ncbi:MAG TPA: uracil-DNA glycosylase [Albitalea sp.]|nr:uracil-DNA glycosylase [Albitalea sp.]
MRWTERQVAMLAEMGIRLWPDVPAPQGASAVEVLERRENPPEAPPARSDDRAPPAVEPRASERAIGARATGVESMDWTALRDAVAACTACKLCKGRRQTVFGIGHPRAQWMIVGEAPGEQEDIQGEPFVGKSGQLLDNMLRALGLSRHATPSQGQGAAAPLGDPARQVYIANTLKCRPPGNRNPEPDELAQCEPFLIRQIALVQPKLILAMGRFAVQSLLRSSEPIGRLRGRVHRYQGVPLIVTYHPAYLLRNLEDKARAWDDLCLAADTLAALERA